jgi:hypothetical protein
MKLRRPSPSLVISLIALVMASTGTAFAAVTFATNAGKVDGKDARAASATRAQAAGDLVATNRSGDDKGKIPGKFLADVVRGGASKFGKPFEVIDNTAGVQTVIGTVPRLGTVSAQCVDENNREQVEDPSTTITFSNQSGVPVNLARRVGNNDGTVTPVANGATDQFIVRGSNTFTIHLESGGTNYFVNGVVRQDGRGSNNAACLVYGFALRV